jgi:hypothetical protein
VRVPAMLKGTNEFSYMSLQQKVKLINRRGFGYRNFDSFRLHVLAAFGQ